MSLASVKAFVDTVYSTDSIMSELEPYKDEDYSVKLQKAVEAGARHGFNFTEDEFREADAIKNFWKTVAEKPELQDRLKGIDLTADQTTILSEVVDIAQSEGFTFTNDALATISEFTLESDEELSEEQLEKVAGGASANYFSSARLNFGGLRPADGIGGLVKSPGKIDSTLQGTIMCPW